MITFSETTRRHARRVAETLLHEPFQERTWRELAFFTCSTVVSSVGVIVLVAGLVTGVFLSVTFIGVVLVAFTVRGARGLGGWHRKMARRLLGFTIEEPAPFNRRPGFLGWLQAALRDRTGWRAIGYSVLKVPLMIFGFWFAMTVWIDALLCLVSPLWGVGSRPQLIGFGHNVVPPGYVSVGSGLVRGLFVFVSGAILLFVAPWPTRAVVWIDRQLMSILLGPDAVSERLRSLEWARAQTVDTSAATLRRIERDLHDGTQAQLVALAMRLGHAKEKLADSEHLDLDQVRALVDDAHKGAKDAIIELRDIVRGIHPPALDIGLEGALTTLAARSTVPTELHVSIQDRPTPAIEAIAYFSVAELLANVAQHARASRASVTCAQHGGWLRVAVRDDGVGGAQLPTAGSSSSGLQGLAERVRTVDGHLHVASPAGGPSVVTLDLPLHA